jgi:hypothetical protein
MAIVFAEAVIPEMVPVSTIRTSLQTGQWMSIQHNLIIYTQAIEKTTEHITNYKMFKVK